MSKINQGKFVKGKYIKDVDFSKAVLWKNKEISLSPNITKKFKPEGIKTIVFRDHRKNEKWSVDYETAKANATLKTEGQEPQFYLPISIFKRSEIKEVAVGEDVAWFDSL